MVNRVNQALMNPDKSLSRSGKFKEMVGLGFLWLFLALIILAYPILKPSVEVRWETATEVETAGFNLYRGTSRENITQLINQQGVIPGLGSGMSGATYSFTDATVEAGKTYFYLIEEIEYNGNANRYNNDIFTYNVPFITAFSAIPAAISAMLGLFLVLKGMKDRQTI